MLFLSGREAFSYQLDIADPESVERVVEAISAEVGPIDVLVNNAGFGLFENFVEIDLAVARQMFDVNVLGMMTFTQKVAIKMIEAGQGHIINVASMAGKMATAKSTVYSANEICCVRFFKCFTFRIETVGCSSNDCQSRTNPNRILDKADPTGTYLAAVDKIVLDPTKLAKEVVGSMGTSRREINRPFVGSGSPLYTLFPHLGDFIAGNILNKNKGVDQVMKNQWRVILGLVLVLIVVIFAVLNNQAVPVNLVLLKLVDR